MTWKHRQAEFIWRCKNFPIVLVISDSGTKTGMYVGFGLQIILPRKYKIQCVIARDKQKREPAVKRLDAYRICKLQISVQILFIVR